MKTHSEFKRTYYIDSKQNGFVITSKRFGMDPDEKVFCTVHEVMGDMLRHFDLIPIGEKARIVDAKKIEEVLLQHIDTNLSSEAGRKAIIEEILK